MDRANAGRIIFDITTSIRWTGPPVGIVRVERQLAMWALANLPNVTFAFFDPRRMAFCELKGDMSDFLTGDAAISMAGLPGLATSRQRKTDRAPATLRPLIAWFPQSRRMILGRLEVLRLNAARPRLSYLAGMLQKPLMSKRYRDIMIRADGTRRPFIPYYFVIGAPIDFCPDDTLICVGSGWGNSNIGALCDLKSRSGFRFVLLCHDLIPLLFPDLYREYDVDLFRAYMHAALVIADLIIFTSRRSEKDSRAYCVEQGIRLGTTSVVPLGFDGAGHTPRVSLLPDGILPGRFVLLVSTIEPRKGHHMLYKVWRRLILDGVTKPLGYKLVFAGRRGWMVENLLRQIRNDNVVSDQIVIMENVGDDLLAALYRYSAFCVYPSKYEGYGLPVCEAFSHGKALLASNGGALPELVQDLSPCLDPENEELWYRSVKEWIECPDARAPFEEAIKRRFKHPNWSDAAANFFATCASA
jgi:glycosyltransferase involved in cell wall biosynthesis